MDRIDRKLSNLTCIQCREEYPVQPFRYTCDCGGNLDYVFDYDYINSIWKKENLDKTAMDSVWRYLPLLPVNESPENINIRVGATPLIEFPNIAKELHFNQLYIKDDTRNPSGSLKDRASEIAIQHAKELGDNLLIAASTGNAAASLACLSAFHGVKALILAPDSAPIAKLTQILQYGAKLLPVNGSYDDAFDLSFELTKRYGWYSRNTGINPVMSEGKKTIAFEIAEQLNWISPDQIYVPVGDGCIIGAVYKGFYDLLKLGWISKIPALVAVQSENSAAVVNALESGGEIIPVKSNTIADSISVDLPRDGEKALAAVRHSNGFGILVSDEEILQAQLIMSSSTSIFCEPASAAAYAGMLKAAKENRISNLDNIVVLATGTGLKDISSAAKNVQIPVSVSPNIESAEKSLKELIH
ncbi:MAG: threonine synthase [Candidatus Marinimicrobia bacterium]|jgi:threonine synthase|nr:threonine synthase [Candidatus Neomarinimicrobiota bacterium]MBT3633748.1 threonine synthase [Candidatus Neomarinimicrobiota bacterium]MBT3682540.1 threonine synthase [Candidatus Neomarinimicrobiota bacterium]MBT3759304.1 threonine synthase [Candidatus Neomarinimicrobiota bacterium]MBT3894688.1 threonine synthase [Candidatus Neomarinimicrobiota bacterium]